MPVVGPVVEFRAVPRIARTEYGVEIAHCEPKLLRPIHKIAAHFRLFLRRRGPFGIVDCVAVRIDQKSNAARRNAGRPWQLGQEKIDYLALQLGVHLSTARSTLRLRLAELEYRPEREAEMTENIPVERQASDGLFQRFHRLLAVCANIHETERIALRHEMI